MITDDVSEHLIGGLTKLGFKCDHFPEITLVQTREIVDQYVGVVINSKIKADQSFIDLGNQLRFIARLGSGLDIIDLPYAAKRNIAVLSAPEGNCNAVAEHAMGLILNLLNKISPADRQVRSKIWDREGNRGIELSGKRIGIIGFGHTGQALASKLRGFEVEILVYDRFLSKPPMDWAKKITWTTLAELQSASDIISLHVSLNETSLYLVDDAFIQSCKSSVVLINTSRGKTMRLNDLVPALETKAIAGAGLDVFENENPATYSEDEKALYSRLYSCDNVILTPHIAGWTIESKWKIADILLGKIQALEKKQPIGHE